MRKLITGVDADGRSCVVEESEVEPAPVVGIPGFAMALLHAVNQSPPPPRPQGLADLIDTQLPPGHVRWMLIDHAPPDTYDAPNQTRELHHTDTMNLLCVLHGSVEFMLQDGVRQLGPGDCVVINGVDHAYKAGPVGVRLLVVSIGTPPRE